MHSFRDTTGRQWSVVINVFAVKRVRGLLNVDLYALVEDGFAGLGKLLGDPVTFVDVLYCLCKDEADARNVTDEDFGRAMAGDVIEDASQAFLAEYTDFFPNPRVRESLRKVIDAGNQVRDRVMLNLIQKIDLIDVDREAARLIESSGGSPESSG